MRFRPAFVGALLLVVVAGAVVAAGAADSPGFVDGGFADGASPSASSGPSFERADPGLVVRVQLQSNGDARWFITHRYALNDSNETAAFEEFASAVKRGERDVGAGRATYERFAAAASESTGRRMTVENAGWTDSRIVNGTGELTYSFRWTNFGQVQGDRIIVGDAFLSPNGTWFPRLYEGQRLVIEPPAGLAIVGTPADKGLNERALVWDGYREFEPGYLSVVLERTSGETTTTTGTTTTDPGSIDPDEEGLSPFLLGVGFALLLVFVGAGSYFFARWQTLADGDDGGAGAVTEASDGGSPPGIGNPEGAGSATAAGATAGATAGSASGEGATDDGDGSVAGGSGATASSAAAESGDDDGERDGEDADEGVDEALLSDEERVLRLLERNGGRMKQANIVTETGWSNAKVSQLLSGMDDDDDIQKLRIGRENLITLPDENVADFSDRE